ncbi:hypothetical protein Vi05172_g13537 [Venturia inaequalis]|nr:hypothetical protein Vi05172_g13537 [Venturia inaequalis]
MAQFKHDEASTRQHVCEDTEYGLSVIDQLYQDIIFPQRVLYGIPEGAVATEPSDILEERRRREMGAVTHLNLRLGRLRRFCLWTGWLTTRQLVTSLQSTDPIIRLCIFAQRGVANATSVVAKITPLGTVCSSWRWIPAEVDESRKTHHSNIQGTNIPSPVTTFDPGHVMNNLKAQGLAVPTAREPSPLVGILGPYGNPNLATTLNLGLVSTTPKFRSGPSLSAAAATDSSSPAAGGHGAITPRQTQERRESFMNSVHKAA